MVGPSHQLEDRRFHRDLWRDAAAIFLGVAPNQLTKEQRRDFKWRGSSYIYATLFCENSVTRAMRLAGFKFSAGTIWSSATHDFILMTSDANWSERWDAAAAEIEAIFKKELPSWPSGFLSPNVSPARW